ncbi:MAG: arginine decarboxylase, pyruvoyl-dependent [Candidatus Aenigmarchaeota archaeon]|nr:arginine decarboxylase, pyruvoyl-dependent [Candidatus Aenigmarchaeota archaeon]MDW8149805.1 arginine decarboxylase, pyruvoyl-dependent [Candidatus Aenigmarchaeota archaeon]
MFLLPKKAFVTKGVGVSEDRLMSFELALRDASIEKYNLVSVSSIIPANCKIISKEDGIKLLKDGQIVFCVMSRNDSNKPNKSISASIGIAIPRDKKLHGYIAEFHCCDLNEKECGNYVENLAISMLKTKIGNKPISKTFHVVKTAYTSKNLWTTVIAAVVFIL